MTKARKVRSNAWACRHQGETPTLGHFWGGESNSALGGCVDIRVEKRMTQCFVDSSHWYIFSDVAY